MLEDLCILSLNIGGVFYFLNFKLGDSTVQYSQLLERLKQEDQMFELAW